MRVRTLLAASTAGALLAGLTGTASQADPGAVPDARSGHVVAWGESLAAEAVAVPAALAGEQVVNVATSDRASAAVTAEGELFVWGLLSAPEVDAAPTNLTDVVSVSLNFNTGIALKRDGSVVAWGENDVALVPAGLKASAVAAGNGNVFAVVEGGANDGTLATWGTGPAPAPPAGLTDLVDVAASPAAAAALHADGNVDIWGPLAPLLTVPPAVQGHVEHFATDGTAAGAILDDGSVQVWGLGVPAVPAALTGKTVTALDVYSGNAIAATDDGEVYAWGSSADITTLPTTLGDAHVAAVSVSMRHAAVIATDFRAVTPPSIAGTPAVGQTLTATPAELSLTPDAPATGQWYAGADPIASATGTTLVLDAALLGKSITYRTSATRGSENLTSDSAAVGPVTPATAASATTVAVSPAAGSYGAVRKVTATVARTGGGTPTGSVTFTLGGTTANAALSNGKATWTLPKTLAVGTHQVKASYAGDATTDPSVSANATVSVTKATATLAPSKAKVTKKTRKTAGKVVLKVAVRTTNGASPTGTVKVVLKGKGVKKRTVTVKVGANGVATVKLTKVKRGSYTATWTYTGSGTVQGAKTKAKVKV